MRVIHFCFMLFIHHQKFYMQTLFLSKIFSTCQNKFKIRIMVYHVPLPICYRNFLTCIARCFTLRLCATNRTIEHWQTITARTNQSRVCYKNPATNSPNDSRLIQKHSSPCINHKRQTKFRMPPKCLTCA